ncbi:MAG TPA: amino acid ABC transporter substrate-binding protein [Methylomirabilota bacterium]|nr:amino acid ABC transporter substrate-binding protein [Methylomirabilota bacterium]
MIPIVSWGLTITLVLFGGTLDALAQSAAPPIKIGYAISRTGPFAPGAQVTQEPNYLLWADQVNAAGGLTVKGQKRKIELMGYDDRSEVETAVRTFEKLMTTDKVDLILPPWGSGMNFAVAPLANRHGYPMLAPTALSMKLIDMKLPNFFSMLPQPYVLMQAAADMLAAKGVKTVAVIFMDDLFGLENVAAFEPAVKAKGIEIVEKKSYPLGVKDLSPVLRAIKEKNPDAFVGLTYPPDTILASKQAKEISFNPRVFFTAVGTAFPVYKQVIGADAEGVTGIGSWSGKTSPAARAYFEAHVKKFQKEPDRWASAHCWASLQILQAAIEKVGLDRKAIREYVAGHEHATILGPIRFKGSEIQFPGTVSQWVGGDFEVVWPPDRATAQLVIPKPPWK